MVVGDPGGDGEGEVGLMSGEPSCGDLVAARGVAVVVVGLRALVVLGDGGGRGGPFG